MAVAEFDQQGIGVFVRMLAAAAAGGVADYNGRRIKTVDAVVVRTESGRTVCVGESSGVKAVGLDAEIVILFVFAETDVGARIGDHFQFRDADDGFGGYGREGKRFYSALAR